MVQGIAAHQFDSDSVRHARPLKHARTLALDVPLRLELGGELRGVTVAYETYGRLNAARDNAVLVGHAISGDSHVARHDEQDDPGWWDVAVGPGRAIDTNRYFVICPNLLGGCRGTTGPGSIDPATGRAWGPDFPALTIGDMVEVERRLVDDLGIETLLAVVGGSMGGHQALTWATRFPSRVRGVVALATSPRLASQALAFDIVARNAIRRDPQYRGGWYYDAPAGPEVGLAIARMIGHITYLSPEAMDQKFEADRLQPREVEADFEQTFSVGSYLAYQGQKFVERFDANSYAVLSAAMDRFDLGGTPEALAASLRPARGPWLVVSFSSDWLFPPAQSREIVRAVVTNRAPVTYCEVQSACGHDAFLLPDDLDRYGELIGGFLARLVGEPGSHDDCGGPERWRPEYGPVAALIPPGSSVIEAGCGDGCLLVALRDVAARRLIGIDRDERAVVVCVRRGLDAIHADARDGLALFAAGEFDFAVSRALDEVADAEAVLDDLLRVGRVAIVSFRNEASAGFRRRLGAGAIGVAEFDAFCRDRGLQVVQRFGVSAHGHTVCGDAVTTTDVAVFALRQPPPPSR